MLDVEIGIKESSTSSTESDVEVRLRSEKKIHVVSPPKVPPMFAATVTTEEDGTPSNKLYNKWRQHCD